MRAKQLIGAIALGSTVAVHVLGLDNGVTSSPAHDARLRTELAPIHNADIMCDPPTLQWLRDAAHAWPDTSRGRRSAESRVEAGYKRVWVDYHRKPLWVDWRNRDGVPKNQFHTPMPLDMTRSSRTPTTK